MHRKFCLNLQMMSIISLVLSLTLVMLGGCAPPSTTPVATLIPTLAATATLTPEPTVTPVPPATTIPPTETPVPPTPPAATLTPTATPAASAQYQLTFEATWSAETHPIDFPSNPHFSGLIGASHTQAVRLWEEGGAATPGIKNMAETGGKSPLDSEIDARIADGSACAIISGGGISSSPGVATVTFTVNQDCPVVSVVSMIAPSPDWFVGVSSLSLFEDGAWIEQKIVELFPYDAGTDSGGSYASPNEPTGSPEPIHRIETEPLVIEGNIPPLGTFAFSRMDG